MFGTVMVMVVVIVIFFIFIFYFLEWGLFSCGLFLGLGFD